MEAEYELHRRYPQSVILIKAQYGDDGEFRTTAQVWESHRSVPDSPDFMGHNLLAEATVLGVSDHNLTGALAKAIALEKLGYELADVTR